MWMRPGLSGPRREVPASPARLRAQRRQLEKQMAEGNVELSSIANEDLCEDWCESCGYMINHRIGACSRCFKAVK